MDFVTIATTIGLSSLIATVVSGFITSRNSKKEREFSLQKEEYYNLQQKAEHIFGYMYQYDQRLNMMFGQLESHMISLQDLNKGELELNKYRQQIYEVIHVYFWDKSNEYNEYSKAMANLMDIYFDVAYKQNMTKEDVDKLGQYEPEFQKNQFKFTEAILGKIQQYRDKLNK
ncbi:hypothetical protein IT412_03750 [Candidatus Peregrinibacteria bacterium]|nr:hypothetical protein [Candidatus Peregrinibacteria bacterium]